MSRDKDRLFAPTPPRCIRDPRLVGSHFRLLALIAMHDRLGKNGSGCYASLRRLANLLDWNKSNVSHVLSDLESWGYVATTVSEANRRTHIRRVLYTADDQNWDREGCAPAQPSGGAKGCAPVQPSEAKGCAGEHPMVVKNAGKIDASPCADTRIGSEEISSKRSVSNSGDPKEADRAEARSRVIVRLDDAERYLERCEATVASDDRDMLKGERQHLTKILDDMLLPESFRRRAGWLLGEIAEL
jgi:hypothetical protein